jgi:alpha-tubulin suppressor-like RCC1 family protein
VLTSSCFDPASPRAGVPTLDDPGTDGFVAVSAGLEHTCALTADGAAWCWGSNEFGQLGVANDGTTCPREDRNIPCRTVPAAVQGGLRFAEIRAGGSHSCGLTDDLAIHCWGNNRLGALGNPSVVESSAPVALAFPGLFIDVSTGGSHTCAVRTDGQLFCWGSNEHGQLGVGTTGGGAAVPLSVFSSQRFASVAVGERRSCARNVDGMAYCWGFSLILQGSGATTGNRPQPFQISDSLIFHSLTVGGSSTCGISAASHAFCWELNAFGSMGDGTSTGGPLPRRVASSLSFVAISSGERQTCAISDGGAAYCWGANELGQLGVSPAEVEERCRNGDGLVPCSRVPLRASGWRVFSQLSAGLGNHACGLTLGGNIYCWGAGNMGQRGDGRTSRGEWSPVKTASPAADN